jgi:secernin
MMRPLPQDAPIAPAGCDTLVALPTASRDGCTLFAKNSDRPLTECQPLVQFPSATHAPSAEVRCQYLTIPQARRTYGFIAAQPDWLWGVELGVNERQVAIGNEAVFTRDPVPETGLLGMDLVRLGLERAETAREGVEVITELLETYGQGGPALPGTSTGYHNSYLLADPSEAWVLETSGRHWAARHVHGVSSISNLLTIDDEWDMAAADLEAHARSQGWWPSESGELRFAAAYRNEAIPGRISEGRLARSRALLQGDAGQLTERLLMTFMRDHGETGTLLPEERDPESPSYFTLCLHADPLQSTTASMIARLCTSPDGRPDAWACLGSPCTSVYLPLYLDGALPPELSRGGPKPDKRSPWWRLKALRDEVLAGPRERLVELQRLWGEMERGLFDETERLAPELLALSERGDEAGRRLRSDVMARAAAEMLRRLDDLGY